MAVAILAGCSGSQPPIGAPGVMEQAPSAVNSMETVRRFIYSTGNCIDSRAEAFVTGAGCGAEMLADSQGMLDGRFGDLIRHFSAGAPAVAPRPVASPDYKASHSLLFVTNSIYDSEIYGDVAIYNAKDGSRVAIITDGIDGPGFDCIDAAGTLYVPQNGSIAEYALGHVKPFQYITEGTGEPIGCAIDAKGNLWVAAISDVIEYLKGSTQPHKLIKDGVESAIGIVFDHHGNMYVSNRLGTAQQSFVSVYPPRRKAPSRTITDGLFYPEGITIDTDGNLYVANFGYAKGEGCGDIVEYRAGQSKPFRTITDEISGPDGLAFANGLLYEDNGGNAACKSNSHVPLILEFPFGWGKASKKTIAILRAPVGLAYYPPQLP